MVKLEKLVVATRNPAKVDWYKGLFSNWVSEIYGLQELGVIEKPDEGGETAEENATIKASFYAKRTKIPAFSEDESLFVDFLLPNEQPGVHVRRINRLDEVDDNKLLAYWERIISKVSKERRMGHWHIAYCLAKPDGESRVVTQDFSIMFFSPASKVKIPGWPMSSLQGSIKFGKPHSETLPEEHEIINQERDRLIRAMLVELID